MYSEEDEDAKDRRVREKLRRGYRVSLKDALGMAGVVALIIVIVLIARSCS